MLFANDARFPDCAWCSDKWIHKKKRPRRRGCERSTQNPHSPKITTATHLSSDGYKDVDVDDEQHDDGDEQGDVVSGVQTESWLLPDSTQS